MVIKMTALRTFDGLEGLKKAGEKFEVKSKNRAENLYKAKFAKYNGKQGQDEKGEIKPVSIVDQADVKTHAELDEVVTLNKLDGIPTKADGATLEERKQAVKLAIG